MFKEHLTWHSTFDKDDGEPRFYRVIQQVSDLGWVDHNFDVHCLSAHSARPIEAMIPRSEAPGPELYSLDLIRYFTLFLTKDDGECAKK